MLTVYKRGATWWAKGRVEYNGADISPYLRFSTGSSNQTKAAQIASEYEAREIRRYIVGSERSLTFADAILEYKAKPNDAGYLAKILPHLGEIMISDISPRLVRDLGPKIYPTAATDTWHRQIITPVSAVINNAHDLGLCPPIRIKTYSPQERIAQDRHRGKQSRPERKPGSWEWLDSVRPYCNAYVAAGNDFMFETGARISQIIAIEPQDLDLPNCRVFLPSSKGHPDQWISISSEMRCTLANLPPRAPHNSREGYKLSPRVFGYADRTGYTAALRKACKAAGIEYLSPHQLGRHGFFTELTVRQGVDPVTAAKAGRWSGPALPNARYAHSDTEQREIRDQIRTNRVQDSSENTPK